MMLAGDNGILNRAVSAKTKTGIAQEEEAKKLEGIEDVIDQYTNNTTGTDQGTTKEDMEGTDDSTEIDKSYITNDVSYVGCYADIEGDGTVDGIIFADLAKGNTGTGTWNPSGNSVYASNGKYTIPTVEENLKSYYISKTYNGKNVLSPDTSESGTIDRFYVMALTDFTANSNSTFYWYYWAYSESKMIDCESYTSTEFGKGKENTRKMIDRWNRTDTTVDYGIPNDRDVWGVIQDKYSKEWFVPSREEWSAFGGELGITKSNYSSTYGLSTDYWSSSQRSIDSAWYAYFGNGCMNSDGVDNYHCVRLATTF